MSQHLILMPQICTLPRKRTTVFLLALFRPYGVYFRCSEMLLIEFLIPQGNLKCYAAVGENINQLGGGQKTYYYFSWGLQGRDEIWHKLDISPYFLMPTQGICTPDYKNPKPRGSRYRCHFHCFHLFLHCLSVSRIMISSCHLFMRHTDIAINSVQQTWCVRVRHYQNPLSILHKYVFLWYLIYCCSSGQWPVIVSTNLIVAIFTATDVQLKSCQALGKAWQIRGSFSLIDQSTDGLRDNIKIQGKFPIQISYLYNVKIEGGGGRQLMVL